MIGRWLGIPCLLGACGGDLPRAGREAREALAQALEERDPERVGATAREAARWEGRDRALDLLLGDALANVLMRPEEGLTLLLATRDPADERWQAAWAGAVLRAGDIDAFAAAVEASRPGPVHLDALLMEQLTAAALKDPELDLDTVVEIIDDCALIDAQPRAGRGPLDRPVPADLEAGARALGATRISYSRGERPGDPAVGKGLPPFRCRAQRRVGPEALAIPLPRALTVGATDGQSRVFLTVREQEGGLWAFAAWPQPLGQRWLDAAELHARGGVEAVRAELGTGLAVPASAAPTPTVERAP